MSIPWVNNFEIALQASREQRKPVFLQFERENCSGCRKLDAVTYPQPEVEAELRDWFIPLRLDILKDRHIRSRYAAVWTPSFYVLDHSGKMYFHLDGYLNPEDFRIILRLGKAAADIPRGKYRETVELMTAALDMFPDNPRSPTLMLQKGIALFLATRDNRRFRETLADLRRRYPESAEARQWPWEEE